MYHRAALMELMDEPCSYEELRGCLRDLGKVGHVTGVHSIILRWLVRVVKNSAMPLHVLDVGCGGGHLLRHIEQWSRRNNIALTLTGIDLNQNAICAAREFTPSQSGIRWTVGDAESFSADEPVDIIVSSYLAHHLDDAKLIRFLSWMEHIARRGWMIHDLYRSHVAVTGFRAMAWAAGWHRFIRVDGVTSIRRAFIPAEWQHYIRQAGITSSLVRIVPEWPVRICVMREKEP